MTPALIEHLKHFEGWVPHPYKCPAGFPTIGYGHRIPDMNHEDLTPLEGEALLIEDIQVYEDMALRYSPDLTGRRLDAITDFCFNLGGSKYERSTLRLRVNEQRWPEAARENSRWIYITLPSGNKVKSNWQIKRRLATSIWLRDG